jgi:HAE1 family hydrophobic/amphiphilic exporter-1
LLGILFALPGVAATLAVTGTPMNLMAQIGLLILMGLVVNHGVVFLDRVGQLERSGLPRDEAFVAAGRQRLRPIVMTVATTVVGLAPLALRGSAVGGLFYYPLARVVIGGLISSAALTLFALPVLVAWVEGVAAGWAGLRRASRP